MWWAALLNSLAAVYASGGAGGGGSSYESIATATGTGSSATITFSSIPSTYTSLQIRMLSKNTRTADSALGINRIRLNGDTGANYVYHGLLGDGSAASAQAGTAITFGVVGYSPGSGGGNTNTLATTIIDIHNYAITTQNKTVRSISGTDQNVADTAKNAIVLNSSLWLDTSAITSISLIHNDGSWTTNSTFALYGIKGA
jgi:hypothetical protein